MPFANLPPLPRDRLRACYWIETPFPLAEAAAVLAGEQSCGTFTRLPGETDALRAAAGAIVERITALDAVSQPSLPTRSLPARLGHTPRYQRAEIVVSWPLANLGASLSALMATVAGNLFELREFSGLRLLDLQLPAAFAHAYRGPQFGIRGTRSLLDVTGRPLIGTIIKPSVGLDAAATADLVRQLLAAGIDFIKDDELQANGPHNPLRARVDAVMPVIRSHEQHTGRRVMYAFNISDEIEAMRAHHDHVVAAGGNCVMVTVATVGLAGVAWLRSFSQVAIHGHRAGWGLLSRSPAIGMDSRAWQQFWRLAGVDHLHVNGLRNKFSESDETVIAAARACVRPMFAEPDPGCEVMPVFSSAQSAEQVADTYRGIGSTDLIYCCGGGIMGHPGGIASGVQSVREAWEAATQGQSLEAYAATHPALAQAIQHFRPAVSA
ncbi:MAG: ribulose-bisphosphate carboxylase large subunit family protein [Pseudomonadota bacterium]|nr:ribulose-bisphosphate carboxylase large subunit family protein [Pseudomonadota bacterium]